MSRVTVDGTLKHGLTLNGEVQMDFVLREALAEDLFAAEGDATPERPMTFRAALLARQLVSLGAYTGPFTLQMIGKLRAADLTVLMNKQRELDALGEDEQPGSETA